MHHQRDDHFRLPQALRDQWRCEPAWLSRLPVLVDEYAHRWNLELEEPFDTPHSLVIPAGDVVLKLNAPSHFEADHEAAALERWLGHGAVTLIGHDATHRALLLERCRPGTRLADDPTADPCAIVADLLTRLPPEPGPHHPFRSMVEEARGWAEDVPLAYEAAGQPFERRLLDLSVDVFRSADPGATSLVNQDLHEENVLRAEREPWLVIDPKPAIGEREVNGVGLLRNAALSGGPRAVSRWLDILAELGYDRARTAAWGVAHALAWGCDSDGRWLTRSIDAARSIATEVSTRGT